MRTLLLLIACILGATLSLSAQENINLNKFRQLKTELATPNVYRNAAGAPGHEYWQQQADYKMKIRLDDEKQMIHGEETITYHNNSPDVLSYIWLQLDQNMRAKDSDSKKIKTNSIGSEMSFSELKKLHNDFDGGFKIESVTTSGGGALKHSINKTMMRIDLPSDLKPGAQFSFKVKWWYNINDRMAIGGRSGYEYFEKDDNYLYTIAQFFPRMCVYNEIEGWQNKQFLGRGEFALPFGDYEVEITVPSDHLVAATGELQNATSVLTGEQRKRFDQAKRETKQPIIIATQEEAEEREGKRSNKNKTWKFKAENVRDFGFATSRKFIWDAMSVELSGKKVLAMSMYPKEGNPLWEQYSTKAVAHTLEVYSKYTFDYPYPVAWSIHAARIGMEYPMICFNFGRPEADGTYSARTKYGMIGVIIHEVGHNFFPMIVNSDERQWTWMDEGLNTFVQYLTEQEWEKNYPSRRGPAYKITDYMGGDKSRISPIMTNSEAIHQFGANAYAKPATALNILRETVMGRELFDHAFKEYSQRWMFKHPSPADFFRTMEDASGVDLDWFWRGWFYTTDHCDISLDDVKWFQINSKEPKQQKAASKKKKEDAPKFIGDIRNAEIETYMDRDESLGDFYNDYDPFAVSILDDVDYERYIKNLSDEEKELLESGYNYYQLTFSNIGGLVMPLIVEFTFEDGSTQVDRIPAEVWQKGKDSVSKIFVLEKKVVDVQLDPFLETADINTENNTWPAASQPSKFTVYKRNRNRMNPMQKAAKADAMKKALEEKEQQLEKEEKK